MTVGVGGFLLKGGINMPGGSALYGSGSHNVVRYRTVDSAGDILEVDAGGVSKFGLDGELVSVRTYIRSKQTS